MSSRNGSLLYNHRRDTDQAGESSDSAAVTHVSPSPKHADTRVCEVAEVHDHEDLEAAKSPRATFTEHNDSGSPSSPHLSEKSSTEPDIGEAKAQGRRWETTLLRIGPIAGLCSLVSAVMSLLVALTILITSRGDPKTSWSVPPSSWLAICTAVANQALRFAAFQGVAIAWWFKALKGSSLGRLHSDWYSGTHVLGALAAGRRMGWVGLACIFSTLVAIDGPFMQRATTLVSTTTVHDPVSMNVTIAPEVAQGFTGLWGIMNATADREGKMFNASVPSPNGSVPNSVRTLTYPWFIKRVGQLYWQEAQLPDFIRGCPSDLCEAKVRGPALAVTDCSLRRVPLNHTEMLNTPITLSTLTRAEHAPPIELMTFIVQPNLVLGERFESINLVTAWTGSRRSTLNVRACNLVSAIGEYDVTIRKNIAALDKPVKPRILAIANNTQVASRTRDGYGDTYSSTLGGIVYLTKVKWGSYAVQFSSDGGASVSTWSSNSIVANSFVQYTSGGAYPGYRDPSDDVLQSMNELMFYEGVIDPTITPRQATAAWYKEVLDPGQVVNVTTTGHNKAVVETYQTDFLYFVAAAIIEVASIALILPTYIGFWKLGRHVTFSPLEIAKAFEAPILLDCNSNSTARDMAKAKGAEELKYGVCYDSPSSSAGRLVFGDSTVIKSPEKGVHLV